MPRRDTCTGSSLPLAEKQHSLENFMALTGLKEKYAKMCLDHFGGYAPALASFAQSYTSLPKIYFDRENAAKLNIDKINEELKLIYKRARQIRSEVGATADDKAVWSVFYTHNTKLSIIPRHTIPLAQCGNKKRYCEPSHFTGPFLDMPLFWKEEVEGKCPLLGVDRRVLDRNRCILRKRLEILLNKAMACRRPVDYVEIDDDEDEEAVRVIIKDAEHIFFHPDHRKKFVAFLNAMSHEFKAYGQAMSHLAGLCLLVLNEEETAAVLRFVLKVHIPANWAAEAVGFAVAMQIAESFVLLPFKSATGARGDAATSSLMYSHLESYLKILCEGVVNVKEVLVLFEFLGVNRRSYSAVDTRKFGLLPS